MGNKYPQKTIEWQIETKEHYKWWEKQYRRKQTTQIKQKNGEWKWIVNGKNDKRQEIWTIKKIKRKKKKNE